jgi:hypothetical protein
MVRNASGALLNAVFPLIRERHRKGAD